MRHIHAFLVNVYCQIYFLIDHHHSKTSIRNLWKPQKCQSFEFRCSFRVHSLLATALCMFVRQHVAKSSVEVIWRPFFMWWFEVFLKRPLLAKWFSREYVTFEINVYIMKGYIESMIDQKNCSQFFPLIQC